MEESKNTTKVEIFGQTYTVKGDADSSYISELACYVDDQMREVAKKHPHSSSNKVSILAALNIANEVFKLKEKEKNTNLLIEEKAKVLVEILDKEVE
jgi:cell division protein ZapA